MPDPTGQIVERLTRLGFSLYEARTYVGLLVAQGSTGYSVANETGVPQPKVYETLRRLVDRGAAVQSGVRPARYTAVSPRVLLTRLEEDFHERLDAARLGLDKLPAREVLDAPLPVSRLDTFAAAVDRTARAIENARDRVYLHGGARELKALSAAVGASAERGVEYVIVHFGPLPFAKPRGQVLRHASTEGTLYASRKVRHLAVVVDSRWSLWALARDGRTWEGMWCDEPLVASLVKTYIRHDLFVQRIYADTPGALEELYGPGLLGLADLSGARDEQADELSQGAG
jgi:HTH-type transcriptional regulator, sugar sensing transcriptional regulator